MCIRDRSSNLHDIVRIFRQESVIHDNLQEEMLRIVLKRFIITCTRIARQIFGVGQEKEKTFRSEEHTSDSSHSDRSRMPSSA